MLSTHAELTLGTCILNVWDIKSTEGVDVNYSAQWEFID